MPPLTDRPPARLPTYGEAFPGSTKVYLEGNRVRVPVREIALSGGESPLQVYDPSGPQGVDVRHGLPPLRSGWVEGRNVETISAAGVPGDIPHPAGLRRPRYRGRGVATQLHYARKGEITPEMEFVALREGLLPELCRSEGARAR